MTPLNPARLALCAPCIFPLVPLLCPSRPHSSSCRAPRCLSPKPVQAAEAPARRKAAEGSASPLPGRGRPAAARRARVGGRHPRSGVGTWPGMEQRGQGAQGSRPRSGSGGCPGGDITGGRARRGATARAAAGSGPAVPGAARRGPEAGGVAAQTPPTAGARLTSCCRPEVAISDESLAEVVKWQGLDLTLGPCPCGGSLPAATRVGGWGGFRSAVPGGLRSSEGFEHEGVTMPHSCPQT